MLHTHLINILWPGSYNTAINKLLRLNNLPTVNLPENPPSLQILSIAKATEEEEHTTQEANKDKEIEGTEQAKETEQQKARQEEESRTEEQEEDMPELEQLMGKDLGLEMIT